MTKSQLGITDGDIYYFNYVCTDVFNIMEYDGNCYFRINGTSSQSIVVSLYNKVDSFDNVNKSSVIYKIKPSFIIKNNYIYSYYNDGEFSKEFLNVKDNEWVLLICNSMKRYFMLKKGDIVNKMIPKGNYHIYILPNELDLIKYDVNIDIDEMGNVNNIQSIPTYSFYMIGD